jgi:hypothetical protein
MCCASSLSELRGMAITATASMAASCYRRTLGVYVTRTGFAFAIIEERGLLVAWGTARLEVRTTGEFCKRIGRLIGRYKIVSVALEDHTVSRRGAIARQRTDALTKWLDEEHLPVTAVARHTCLAVLGLRLQATNRELSRPLVALFPELDAYAPPARKLWQSESGRTAVFRAIAMTLAARSA